MTPREKILEERTTQFADRMSRYKAGRIQHPIVAPGSSDGQPSSLDNTPTTLDCEPKLIQPIE